MSPELQYMEWILQELKEIKEGINKQQESIIGIKESIKNQQEIFSNIKDRIKNIQIDVNDIKYQRKY